MREVMASAVKHLHAFAQDVNLTPAEWIKGIEFMTAVGKICTPARQEFILLSDTLGLSALVNGLHDETAMEEGTHTSLLGPFYREATPTLPAGSQIAKTCQARHRMRALRPRQRRQWQAARQRDGFDLANQRRRSLRHPGRSPPRSTIAAFSQPMRTGSLSCARSSRSDIRSRWTARSATWSRRRRRHGMRPAHIHFLVGAPGYRELVTALYLRDDPHLADDVVFGSSGDLAVDIAAQRSRNARSRACRASASICDCRAKARPTRPAAASAPIRPRS